MNNTDAEGRLTLADALVYACNQGVEKVLCLIGYHSFVLLLICAAQTAKRQKEEGKSKLLADLLRNICNDEPRKMSGCVKFVLTTALACNLFF